MEEIMRKMIDRDMNLCRGLEDRMEQDEPMDNADIKELFSIVTLMRRSYERIQQQLNDDRK